MNESNPPSSPRPRRPAWNKGKMPGPKPPLRPGHVWAIRAKLQLEKRTRDLAMFNLAIDSKLRGCDFLGPSSGPRKVLPVMFPSGRARLVTNPSANGSAMAPTTIGTVAVVRLAANAAGVPPATITSTLL